MSETTDQLNAMTTRRARAAAESESILGKMRAELDFAREKRFNDSAIQKLESDLKTMTKIHADNLAGIDAEIDLLRRVIDREQKDAYAAAKQRAAESEAESRDRYFKSWIESGGDPDEFESVWRVIRRADLVKETAIRQATETKQSADYHRNLFSQ